MRYNADYNIIEGILDSFRSKYSIFSSLVLAYSSFNFSDSVKTAAVTFNKNSGKFVSFLFNRKFYESLNSYEVEFVVAHECLHIFFEHGLRGINVNNVECNIAMDVVINEALVNYYGYDRCKLNNIKPHFINNTFDSDEDIRSDMSFEYYLNKLQNRPRKYIEIDNHTYIATDGSSLSKKVSEHDSVFNPFQLEKTAKLAGNTSRLEDIQEKLKKQINHRLAKLVTKMTRYSINEHDSQQWILPNRRLSEVNFLLPQNGEMVGKCKSKINLAFFADVSGSCISHAKTFYNTLFSMPESRINCKYFLFDTDFVQIKKGDNMKNGGGTDFKAIELAIESSYKTYPDLVFVMTDGYSSRSILPKYPNRWHVFIVDGGTGKDFVNVKNIHKYNDYIRDTPF